MSVCVRIIWENLVSTCVRACVCVFSRLRSLSEWICVVCLSLQAARLSAPSGENGAPVGVITWRCVQSHMDVCPGPSVVGLNKDTVNPITCCLSGPSLTLTFQVTQGNQSDYTSKTLFFFSTAIDEQAREEVSTLAWTHWNIWCVQTSVKHQCLFFYSSLFEWTTSASKLRSFHIFSQHMFWIYINTCLTWCMMEMSLTCFNTRLSKNKVWGLQKNPNPARGLIIFKAVLLVR